MTLDLCIPAYNEAEIIADSVSATAHALREMPGLEWRITVADNGSTDGTSEAALAAGIPAVRVLAVAARGKGAALAAAARDSQAELFGFIDADLSADPRDLMRLIPLIASGEADIAVGSRFLDTRLVQRGAARSLLSRLFNLLRRALLGIRVTDSQCGLKLMNARGREMLAQCHEEGWFIDMEFLRRAELARLRIRELPIHWDEKRFAGRRSKLRVLSDGVGALRAMVRIRRSVSASL